MIRIKNTYTKLMLFFLVLILLPSIAIGVGMYYAASNIIKKEVSVSVSNTLKMNAESIDARLRNIEYLSLPLIMDDKLESILSKATNFDTFEDVQNLTYLQEALSRVVYSSQNVESLYLMNIKNGYTFSSDNFILYKNELTGTIYNYPQ